MEYFCFPLLSGSGEQGELSTVLGGSGDIRHPVPKGPGIEIEISKFYSCIVASACNCIAKVSADSGGSDGFRAASPASSHQDIRRGRSGSDAQIHGRQRLEGAS